jgi:hypothetical protein
MARWMRQNPSAAVALLSLLLGLAGAGVALYSRAALADTDKRVTVLETLRHEDAKNIDEIKSDVKEILRTVRSR